tara:strand:+ start:1294 stop:2139 length:846 start_codon:yes stop_codon:yes gene_type:complete
MKFLKFELPPTGFKRLFYDIETSYEVGKFWRPSFKAVIRHTDVFIESAIICISYKWEGQKTVHTLSWDEGNDKELLQKFVEVAIKADEIIGHNGDNFDEKIIRTRCLFHHIPCPSKFPSLDTLKKARRHFKMDSNTLEHIAVRLTGEGKGKMEYADWDLICKPLIPKHFGFEIELPKSYHTAMRKMIKYCELDVIKLEEVFHELQPYIDHNHHAGEVGGFGRYSCPKCGNDKPFHNKSRYTKAGILTHSLKCPKGCGYYTVSNAVWLQKLKADFEESLQIR